MSAQRRRYIEKNPIKKRAVTNTAIIIAIEGLNLAYGYSGPIGLGGGCEYTDCTRNMRVNINGDDMVLE